MKKINKMKITKKSILIIIGFIVGITSSVLAATWQSTAWINNGAVIDATKLKANLDQLKPTNCSGQGKALQWNENAKSYSCADINGTSNPFLPKCSLNQIIKWNGSSWICADVGSNGGSNGGNNGGSDGGGLWKEIYGSKITPVDGKGTDGIVIRRATFKNGGKSGNIGFNTNGQLLFNQNLAVGNGLTFTNVDFNVNHNATINAKTGTIFTKGFIINDKTVQEIENASSGRVVVTREYLKSKLNNNNGGTTGGGTNTIPSDTVTGGCVVLESPIGSYSGYYVKKRCWGTALKNNKIIRDSFSNVKCDTGNKIFGGDLYRDDGNRIIKIDPYFCIKK